MDRTRLQTTFLEEGVSFRLPTLYDEERHQLITLQHYFNQIKADQRAVVLWQIANEHNDAKNRRNFEETLSYGETLQQQFRQQQVERLQALGFAASNTLIFPGDVLVELLNPSTRKRHKQETFSHFQEWQILTHPANFPEQLIIIVDLAGVNLEYIPLSLLPLRGAILRGQNLELRGLQGVDLSFTDLSKANLRGANLKETNLAYSNLTEADLTGAHLMQTNLDEADLTNAIHSDISLARSN